jgi:DNA repair protein RecN (Recombination protein N)
VLGELAQLGMEKTRFSVDFDSSQAASASAAPVEPASAPARFVGGPRGIDSIEFLISPNPGEELRPLEKIASGGEVSRLMLALKTVAGQAESAGARGRSPARSAKDSSPAPTFIFDEVDAGIGGRIAECVGLRLKRLARDAQVLCVTHLPQIACFADHHFYVEKLERGGRTVTTVRHLETQKDRVAELARMLSGSQITDAVLKHAATMLKNSA